MKIHTQTRQNMLSSKVLKTESSRQEKQQKINVKRRYRFKKATLYQREVMKKQTFFSPAEASVLIQHLVGLS
jgi:hypothetical protein